MTPKRTVLLLLKFIILITYAQNFRYNKHTPKCQTTCLLFLSLHWNYLFEVLQLEKIYDIIILLGSGDGKNKN